MFKIKEGFQFKQIALLDSWAAVNCIKEGLVPSKYFEKSTHKVQTANGGELKVKYKIPEVHVWIGKTCIQTLFLLVKNLTQGIILGNPFLTLIQSFTITKKGIISSIKGKRVRLRFCSKPKEAFLNQLEKVIKGKKKF